MKILNFLILCLIVFPMGFIYFNLACLFLIWRIPLNFFEKTLTKLKFKNSASFLKKHRCQIETDVLLMLNGSNK
jgi:hypothetical protein